MRKGIIKTFVVMTLLFFTTGIVFPWIVSNVVMPLWMIIFSLMAVLCMWCLVFEKPFRKLITLLTKKQKEENNEHSA